jgi:hypothetical protein
MERRKENLHVLELPKIYERDVTSLNEKCKARIVTGKRQKTECFPRRPSPNCLLSSSYH